MIFLCLLEKLTPNHSSETRLWKKQMLRNNIIS